ncbi:hypothetical protein, partial [Enterococcus cecorum]|uniref:hypothetical protein n=1 Tax=Enterococcus cecorum TaxID=44008 RepID=UPI001FAC1728
NHTKPNIGGKPSIFHPKKQKIEGIFHGCLRFFCSNGTNGSAPFALPFFNYFLARHKVTGAGGYCRFKLARS